MATRTFRKALLRLEVQVERHGGWRPVMVADLEGTENCNWAMYQVLTSAMMK